DAVVQVAAPAAVIAAVPQPSGESPLAVPDDADPFQHDVEPVAAEQVPAGPLEYAADALEAPAATGEVTPGGLVEAMIFAGDAGGAPLSSQRIASLVRGVSPAEVDQHVARLNGQYAENACPYEIVTAGGGYVLALRAEFDGLRERFFGRS